MADLLKLLDRLLRFAAFTLAYLLGKRSTEAEAAKEALKESNRVVTEREKVRAKYIRLKRVDPNVWE